MCLELNGQRVPSADPGSVQYSYGTTSVSLRFPFGGREFA